MEEKRSLFEINKLENEKTKIIMNNIILMLSNRIFVEKDIKYPLLDKDATYKEIGDSIFTLKANNNDNYAIKIIYNKITAIGKQSVINDFIVEYKNYRKIIVAVDYNNKILTFVLQNNIQIFRESSLLQDIISNDYQPKFELLSPKEMESVKKEYHITDYTTEKILKSDPVVKYFALKKGDIIRIIRPSPTSGKSIAYRIVS